MGDELERRRAELLQVLPEGWNFRRDLVLVLGGGAEELVRHHRELGQERILVAVPGDTPDPTGLPEDVPWVDCRHVGGAVQRIGQGVIVHVWVVRTADPNLTPELVTRAREDAAVGLRSRAMNVGTVQEFGRTWLLQGIQNLPDIASRPSVAHLRGAFRGRPAVLVSPGPSLSKQLDLLAKIPDRAVVVSGSHALHALQRAGVRVDLALIIDAGDELLRHFEGLDLASIGALVASVTAERSILELDFARKFLVSVNGPLDEWTYAGVGEDACLATGGSVACAAFSLAREMGCDPIVLVGQDLAFTDGKFYAAESIDGNAEVAQREGRFFLKKPDGAEGPGYALEEGGMQFSREQGVTMLPGYHGGTVQSSEYMRQFHAWFELEARNRAGEARYVNSTEGGARIEGMDHVPFAEMVASFTERFDVTATLEALSRVELTARRAAYTDYLGELTRALDESTFLASRCHRLLERARSDERSFRDLERLEQELSRALQPVRFFGLFAQQELESAQERARDATTLDENLDAVGELMGVVLEAAELLRAPLQEATDAIASPGAAGQP